MAKIKSTILTHHPEPLMHSFGFKGGALTELWQVFVTIMLDDGTSAKGQSIQSVLWSDSRVFSEQGQQRGNALMLEVTARALELLEGAELVYPPQMLERLLPRLLELGREITGNPELRTTFVLNALTGVDFALWKLWRKAQGEPDFDTLFHMDIHQPSLGLIPLLTYDTTGEQIQSLAEGGCFLFKIKIGSNPGGRNDLGEMLRWDCERLTQIHRILSGYESPWTECGHPLYYIDANGRYDTRQRLERFLDHAESIGAKERIAVLEEPFAEDNLQDVRELGVLIAADESAHCASDARRLMDDYGYSAMALKPIAKTLSVSLEVLEEARKRNVPCFCADLTVNPTMVELNKRFAAGLGALPGVKIGVFETNGAQNYVNWEQLRTLSPAYGTSWAEPEKSCYHLNEEYFRNDGNLWKEENP